MTVKVSKPALNVREELADLRKPTGVAGEAMLRAETPQEQFNLIGAGRRNLIINGAMQVAQRGTSATVSTAVNFVADRHKVSVYNTGFSTPSGGSIQQIDITGTNLGGVTFKNATRLTPNSTWALTYFLQQIEDVASVSDADITFSVWMRVGSGTLTLNDDLRITQNFGSGGSTAVNVQIPSSRVLTTEWKKFTWTMRVPSVEGKTIGAGSYLQCNVLNTLDLSSFSSTLDITGFQVELGKVATPFEHRSYGEELALCQRYYYQINQTEISAVGVRWSAADHRVPIYFPTTLRAIPTFLKSRATGMRVFGAGSSSQVTNIGTDSASTGSMELVLYNNRTANSVFARLETSTDYIAFDAEL
jgi:hypothetical protein